MKRKASLGDLVEGLKKLKVSAKKYQMRAPRKIKTKGLKTQRTLSGIKKRMDYALSARDKKMLNFLKK